LVEACCENLNKEKNQKWSLLVYIFLRKTLNIGKYVEDNQTFIKNCRKKFTRQRRENHYDLKDCLLCHKKTIIIISAEGLIE